jgi:Tfp pilus assembly protein PilX
MQRPRRRRASGQVLVVFALSLLTLVGLTGLAVDAGGTFAQRRDQQTAADLAALAAANDYLINGNETLAIDRARAVTSQNGFVHAAGGVDVAVAIDTSNGVEVSVGIDAPHSNTFLGVIGMPTWAVSTSAASLAGFPDTAEGAGPFIFSIGAFEDDGTPKYQAETNFGETNGDIPTSELDFAWTNYGTGNVNTSEVADIISGGLEIERTLEFGQYIGQYNNGNHTALFQDVDTYLRDLDLPVAVVDDAGNFMGWAMFHVTSASAGSDKHVRGYFLSSFTSARLRLSSCALNDCPRYLGTYVLKLSD